MSAGVVIPGVSSTVLLMFLGTYETYLDAVANMNLVVLFPMGIGLILGGFIFLKLTRISIIQLFFPNLLYYNRLCFRFFINFISRLYFRLQRNNINFNIYNLFFDW